MRQTALRATVAATVTAILIALLPAPAQASPWAQIFLEDLPTETCLDIASSSDGAVPTREPCVDTAGQLWTFEDTVNSGWYRLRNTATSKCLAANGPFAVQQLTCAAGAGQLWSLSGSGNTFRVTNGEAGKCLSRQATNSIVLGTCLTTVAQWSLLF